ncbi:hypothetical protein RE628_01110 [Paenibacillus sp. D2_2]|uniref:hypothetical protein n=1 Tax=Paenibacillus sp. D2_2 TaxID=3073092 RepID=UPI00281547B2|nr:hypothetical protein [Paenibacillus sp. D2_2]WMT41246.1 hypothetical protein RE628_01110 [Paenibacillus sp. D2_2]
MKRQVSIGLALLPILALIAAGAASIFIWKAGMFIPLIISIIVTVLVGVMSGYSWKELEEMMVSGVSKALPAIFILLVIGMIVGTWISSGVIPTMIYYGLSFIHPSFFVPAVAVVTRYRGNYAWQLLHFDRDDWISVHGHRRRDGLLPA